MIGGNDKMIYKYEESVTEVFCIKLQTNSHTTDTLNNLAIQPKTSNHIPTAAISHIHKHQTTHPHLPIKLHIDTHHTHLYSNPPQICRLSQHFTLLLQTLTPPLLFIVPLIIFLLLILVLNICSLVVIMYS